MGSEKTPENRSKVNIIYSESKYSVESVSGKYLENGWSDQHRDFSVEFVVEKFSNRCITTSRLTY